MSRQNKKILKLAELRQQGVESLGGEAAMTLEADDGTQFDVPHPMLFDDETQKAIDDAEGTVAMAKVILGDDAHAKFIAAGGHSNDVALAFRMLTDGMMEKVNPTRARAK